MRSGGVDKEPVGLGRARNRREPPIEHDKFTRQSSINRQRLRPEAFHHSFREVLRHGQRLLHKACHGRNCARPKHLLLHGFERVARIGIDELGVVREADHFRVSFVGRDRIALAPGDAIDVRIDGSFHPSKHVIEGPVLQHQYHDCLDGSSLLGQGEA